MTAPLTLEQAKVGDVLLIRRIADPVTSTVAMRLGISEGEVLELASKVPGGPVVIRRGAVEIALGRELCRQIEVEKTE
ncbi:MAG TPA: FeoA family protein [Oculatellaceae cyanobacterium]